MKKRVARIPLCLVFLLSLAACGSHAATPVARPSPAPSLISPCPTEPLLEPGPDAAAAATAAAQAEVPQRYPLPRVDSPGFEVTTAYVADRAATGYGIIPFGMCGTDIGQRTWVVELHFPRMDPQGVDLAHGQLFLGRFTGGWRVWYQYH